MNKRLCILVKKVTIKTVSKASGVSVSIVSRVLNNKVKEYRISEKTAERVRKVAKELNYEPSQLARGFRLNKTFTIGLVFPSIKNPFFAEMSSIIMEEARSRNYFVLLADSEEDPKLEELVVKMLIDRGIDGLFILPSGENNAYLEKLFKNGLPMVFIDRFMKESEVPYVGSDNYQGAVTATQYLLNKGHRNIACIQGTRHAMSNNERIKAFTNEMDKVRGAHHWMVGSSFTEQNGYIQTKRLLKEENPPTAIITLNNLIAFGVIKAIREANLKIPDDISVISFDDQQLMSYLSPPITAIEQPKRAIAEMALNTMLAQIDGKNIVQKKLEFPTKLVVRESVMNLKKVNV